MMSSGPYFELRQLERRNTIESKEEAKRVGYNMQYPNIEQYRPITPQRSLILELELELATRATRAARAARAARAS